jgi:hypothetical protein
MKRVLGDDPEAGKLLLGGLGAKQLGFYGTWAQPTGGALAQLAQEHSVVGNYAMATPGGVAGGGRYTRGSRPPIKKV